MNNNKNQQVITRFAPSPTGMLHVGGARTALFNYLFARQNNGKFILRIEDTDKERSKKEFEEDIINSLKWLGINWDEFYKQSERTEIYKKYLEKLLKENMAYVSEEPKGNSKSVIRLRNKNKKISFDDLIRGKIEFDTTELGDFVIAKDKETPLYHFAVVVDDSEMGVTHVIRGEDHISNTPRQILIQEALGFPRPIYSHIPLILGPDRSKLSKRHGESSVIEYKDLGYLPEALNNFIAFLGWNPGTEKEIYSMEELIKDFSLKKIQKSGAIFNIVRLDWINKEYIKNIDISKIKKWITSYIPEEKINNLIVNLLKERINKLSDIKNLYEAGELNYFFKQPEYEKEKLLWREEKDLNNTKSILEKAIDIIKDVNEENFTQENIKSAIWTYAEEKGRGNVLWPIRMALTGLNKSPDPFVVSEIIGKKEVLKRLKYAILKI
jgi:glutamyl-tRNA synthetase